MGQGPYYDHQWMMGGAWGWLGMVAFWVLLIVALVVLVRWTLVQRGQSPAGGPRLEPPLELLKRRYAAGEIDREEFEQKKKDLSRPDAPP